MKRLYQSLLFTFVVTVFCVGAAFAENPFRPELNVVNGTELFKEFRINKFAFEKKYAGKTVAVVGYVERVGEGQYQFAKGPHLPEILLKGLFYA